MDGGLDRRVRLHLTHDLERLLRGRGRGRGRVRVRVRVLGNPNPSDLERLPRAPRATARAHRRVVAEGVGHQAVGAHLRKQAHHLVRVSGRGRGRGRGRGGGGGRGRRITVCMWPFLAHAFMALAYVSTSA